MARAFTTICCLILCLVTSAPAQDTNVLDLTKLRASSEQTMTGSGGGLGPSMSTPKTTSLKVTLKSLNKTNYYLGERVSYEIMLQNITTHTVVIPWTPDQLSVKPSLKEYPSGYMEGNISLFISDKSSGDQFLDVQSLYGSHLVPNSLKKLRPGERVRILAAGKINLIDANFYSRMLPRLPQTFIVKARVTFDTIPKSSHYTHSESTNRLSITINKR